MWDLMILAGNLIVIPTLIPVMVSRSAYVPRLTSAPLVGGLELITAGLIGAGLYASAAGLALQSLCWLFVFVFKGRRQSDV